MYVTFLTRWLTTLGTQVTVTSNAIKCGLVSIRSERKLTQHIAIRELLQWTGNNFVMMTSILQLHFYISWYTWTERDCDGDYFLLSAHEQNLSIWLWRLIIHRETKWVGQEMDLKCYLTTFKPPFYCNAKAYGNMNDLRWWKESISRKMIGVLCGL